MSTAVIKIHQCISGFTQTQARPHGVLKLSEKLHNEGFNNSTSRVFLHPWNANWAGIAEYFWLLGENHNANVIVNIYAYSWGGGWGAIRLAKQLKSRGIVVQIMVLCDAVYRHPVFLMRWTSLLQRDSSLSPVITVPDNVLRVRPLHQRQNTPQGHKIKGSKTFAGIIDESMLISRDHQYMDDAPEFHDMVLEAAEELRGAA